MKNLKTKKIGAWMGARKVKKLNQPQEPKNNKDSTFYTKIIILTLVFTGGIYILNLENLSMQFFADMRGLLTREQLLTQMDNIQDTTTAWPVKYVTNWGVVDNYEEAKWTNWENLDNEYKTTFPQTVSDIISEYKFVPTSQIYQNISSPFERQKVSFYKRLIRATWTSSYSDSEIWIKDTGTHAGIDIITSMRTPVYSIANGVVFGVKDCGDACSGFGKYLIVATEFKGEVIATFYAHLDGFKSGISEGDIVRKGDLIGYVGNSGNSTAPHLHLQINKLGTEDEVKTLDIAQQLWQGWFHDLNGVKQKTYDPIMFIESHLGITDDALTPPDYTDDIEEKDLAEKLEDELQKDHTSAPDPFRIQDIQISKISDKLLIGDKISATINTTGIEGSITITTSNEVLKPSKYVITNNGTSSYLVDITANSLGNGQIIISDGTNKESYYFSVYDKDTGIYGLDIKGADTIFTTSPTEYLVYPIDKMGNTVSTSLEGQIKVVLENKSTNEKTTLLDVSNTKKDSIYAFDVTAPAVGEYKLKVYFENNGKSFIASKSIKTDLFLDYSQDDEFGQAISYLNDIGIVQGHDGRLMPNKTISRAEIAAILIRQKYGDDLSKFNLLMGEYLVQYGQFFDDIQGTEWYAPYLYMAYRDGIMKGAAGKALPDRPVYKSELLTLFGRRFDVRRYELFTAWMDVKEDDWFKPYADAAKKYNLYPFDQTQYFYPEEEVTREKAFASLYRYIKFNPEDMVETYTPVNPASVPTSTDDEKDTNTSSSTIGGSASSMEKDDSQELESLVRDVLDL